jgi:N-acetylneuraminic acid mutarotase
MGDAAASSSDGAPLGSTDGSPGPGFTWTVAAPNPIARFEANGAVVGDELWVLGGFTSADLQVTERVDIYDPAGDAWRAGPSLPGAQTHIAVVTFGGDLIVSGGFTGAFTGTQPPTTDAVWRWSAASGAWSMGPPLPAAGAAFAWALLGTELHLAGGLAADGSSDTDVHSVWDLAGAATWTTAAPLPDARNHGGGAATGGLFYAIAGRHGWNESSGDVADVDAFDPVSGAWTSRAPIPIARSEIGGATSTMEDGRILVVGGSLTGIVPSADVLVYDPAVDAWCALPSLPEPRKGAVAARIGSRIVVTSGSPTSVDPSATTFVGCCL